MSIAILTQVYDEVRRLAIAGSNLAPGDFRLKKLVVPLETAGKKAPIFGKVAEAAQRLIDSTEKNSADALLELSTLVSSILYTQGETGISGRAKAIECVDLGPPVTGTSARVLKPLMEALTSTGSGRLEIIRDAEERGAFKDMRLVNPTLKALDDPYGEIGDLIADKVLPLYGKTIYPQLNEGIDIKGRAGHVRRLRLMHRLNPDATKELVEETLEAGSNEMKIAALGCIDGSPEGLQHLLNQAKAKAKDVRQAALEGLVRFTDKKAVDALIEALSGKDVTLAIGPVAQNKSPKLLKYLLDDAKAQLETILTVTVKTKRNAALNRLGTLLSGFEDRTDKGTVDFLKGTFERREDLVAIKGGANTPNGSNIVWVVTHLLVGTKSKPILKTLGESHAGLPADVLECCFVAAAQTMTPKKVFDEYSPYLLAKPPAKKKRNDPEMQRRESIIDVVRDITFWNNVDEEEYGYYGYRYYWGGRHTRGIARHAAKAKLDPRWLDAAIDADELDLAIRLLRPKYKPLHEYLESKLRAHLKKRDPDWEMSQVLDAMIKAAHPKVVDLYLESLEKCVCGGKKRYYYGYWLSRLIPSLPKQALAPLEALVPSINEQVVDEIVAQIAELKSKHEGSKTRK